MLGRFIHRLALHYRLIALAAALAIIGGLAIGGLHTSTASAQMYYYTYPSTYSYYYPSYSYYNPYSSYYNPYYSYSYPSYYSSYYDPYYSSSYYYPSYAYYGNPCAAWGYVC